MDKKEGLLKLGEGIRRCTACPLWKTRTLTVPGSGSSEARILILGEAPGAEEDRQGLPFVGRSGKLLGGLLEKNQIERETLFITNCVKCRPPKNRQPTKEEIAICKKLWLEPQMELLKPRLMVILGLTALKSSLGKTKIGDLHGKIIEKDHQKYFISYHPSAALRFLKIKRLMEEDFKRLKKIKKEI